MGNICCAGVDSKDSSSQVESQLPTLRGSSNTKTKEIVTNTNIQTKKKLRIDSLIEQKEHLQFKDVRGFRTITDIGDQFKIEQGVGTGSFGAVFKSTHKATNLEVAIKAIKKKDVNKNTIT